MRALEIQGTFGFDHLKFTKRPVLSPGPGKVRLRMKAACLNYRDLLTVKGLYNPKQPLPLVPGSDGVGVVEEVGLGVSDLQTGDRVMPAFNPGWISGDFTRAHRQTSLGGPVDGTLQETMIVPAAGVVRVPEYLTDAEASTLPCAAVTAWSALVDQGGLRAGETVLVQGTGGVSIFALQIAKAAGAQVMVISSCDDKLAKANALGADHLVNYVEKPDWHKEALEWTDGRGVDHVVEVGGSGTLDRSLKSVRLGGQIAVIGILDGTRGQIDLIPVLMGRVRLQGVMVGSRDTFAAMTRAFEANQIRPVIDRVFFLEEAVDAFHRMESAEHLGKIVVSLE